MNVPASVFSVDVEDWFHLLDTPAAPRLEQWSGTTARVERNTHRILDLLDETGTKGTFFVLGWVAETYPRLVRSIMDRGHEVGSHGFAHALVHQLSPAAFRADLQRSVTALGAATGTAPRAYRAAGFSITPACAWAFDILAETGFTHDSSVFPSGHAHGGFVGTPTGPFTWKLPSGATLAEFPVATWAGFGRRFTFGGGGYFRLLPAAASSAAFRHIKSRGECATFYIHPRDIDPHQPRLMGLGPLRHFKSYVGLRSADPKLRWLLGRVPFGRMCDALPHAAALVRVPCVPAKQAEYAP